MEVLGVKKNLFLSLTSLSPSLLLFSPTKMDNVHLKITLTPLLPPVAFFPLFFLGQMGRLLSRNPPPPSPNPPPSLTDLTRVSNTPPPPRFFFSSPSFFFFSFPPPSKKRVPRSGSFFPFPFPPHFFLVYE